MRFLDTNVFIRLLAWDDPVKGAASQALFKKLSSGDEEVLCSESVVAEVIFVLTSKRHYGMTREEAAESVQPLLVFQGLKFPDKRAILRAMDLYASNVFLDFEDALSVANMESASITDIYSYDTDFDRLDSVTRLEP